MTAIKEKRTKIELTETELKEARIHCGDFVGRNNRNRAVSNILGIKIAKKFFEENGINADDKFSAYKIKKILEDFDIADIRIDGKIVDVRAVFNENMLFIPKSHYDYGITPAFYMFVKINKDLENGEVLGFLDPNIVEDSKASLEYYFPEKENLISVKMFKQKFKKIPYSDYPLKNTKEARRDIVKYYDNILENKTRFIRLIVNNEDVRKAMLEFENAEDLFSNIAEDVKNYEESPVIDEIVSEDYPTDDFYNDNEITERVDLPKVYETVDTPKDMEMLEEEHSVTEVQDYKSPEFEDTLKNEINEEYNQKVDFSDNESVENVIDNEPDSETIDFLDPENSDIEIKKEDLTNEQNPDYNAAAADHKEYVNVDSTEFATENNPYVTEDISDEIAEEPQKEIQVIDDFLIVDFDNDIGINKKPKAIISDDEEPHLVKEDEISNILAEDIENSEIHIDEADLPKAEEELQQDKQVETDLDKLFKSGSSDESEAFDDDNEDDESYIIEEKEDSSFKDEQDSDNSDNNAETSEIKIPELEELDNLVGTENELKSISQKKVRRIIILAVGTAFIVSTLTAGITAYMFNNIDVVRFDENPANKLQVKEIPLNPVPEKNNDLDGLKNLDLPKDTGKEFYVLPPSTTELEPNGFDIKNIDVSWDIPEICVDTPEKKNKLLLVGRKIKLALSNDLLLTDEKPTQKNLIINLMVRDKNMKVSNIQATSGSIVIDKMVIQTVNDILRGSKLTLEGLNNETGYPSLIISF